VAAVKFRCPNEVWPPNVISQVVADIPYLACVALCGHTLKVIFTDIPRAIFDNISILRKLCHLLNQTAKILHNFQAFKFFLAVSIDIGGYILRCLQQSAFNLLPCGILKAENSINKAFLNRVFRFVIFISRHIKGLMWPQEESVSAPRIDMCCISREDWPKDRVVRAIIIVLVKSTNFFGREKMSHILKGLVNNDIVIE
jgi:hypothetical protein